jgi:hypothetical protein
MIVRFLLILASLVAIGIVGAFLLFVSALSLLTTIAAGIGLLATWVLGYWAGSTSINTAPRAKRLQKLSVINAPEDSQRDSSLEQLCEVTPIR